MKNVVIEQSFFEIFPEAQINVLVVKDIDNSLVNDDSYDVLLEHASSNAKQFLSQEAFSDNLIVKQWREDYTKFKKKKGARSSIESLLKRVSQGKSVGTINPLVDIYNSISMSYGVPVGGEDLDAIVGDLTLGVASGGEPFSPLGDDENDPALSGEIIYSDDKGAVCRCLNWRDGKRTMLTEETTNAVLCIESTRLETRDQINNATNELQRLIEDKWNQPVAQYRLSKDECIASIQ